jgi:hypothetical protein
MTPARGIYCLKVGVEEFFRYSAPKIVRCRVCESCKKILRRNIRPFFASESEKRYSANASNLKDVETEEAEL